MKKWVVVALLALAMATIPISVLLRNSSNVRPDWTILMQRMIWPCPTKKERVLAVTSTVHSVYT